MKTARFVCIFALLLVAATDVFAASKKGDKSLVAYYKTIDKTLKPVTLTDDEKSKLDALKKDYEQKFTDAYAKCDVLTPDQKKAAADAKAANKAAGKKGQEAKDAVAAAVKETDDQKAKAKDALKALHDLQKEFKGKVLALLTDDQKQQLTAGKGKKSSKAPGA